ncbi:type II toxin-antitoxin system RelE/ParE family toxin [Luteimonas aquatica]|uniref:type II toxin-antitoxin system RelE/ParE family toxin n=1 Tax=Luteimonas aquatica TaxID=450364 RepID=UPI001F5A2175|nr:type II toxin-antitoxin system RelE/ParE family toxin [Luteimonas aquatica]
MSRTPRRTDSGARDRGERMRSRIAVLVTALLHLSLVLLVIWAPPITVTRQGGDAGGSMEVTFIDPSLRPSPAAHPPAARVAPPRKRAKAAPKASRIRTTPVMQSEDPVQPDSAAASDTMPPSPDEVPEASPHIWGQPPGMLAQDSGRANTGSGRGMASTPGRSAGSSGPSMQVDGYEVYYSLVRETHLRALRDQGMTELSLPLPGTRRLMVCPLELMLRRDSGVCRMVEPDAPELNGIGDARDVIDMREVYKLGKKLWSGPGPYR